VSPDLAFDQFPGRRAGTPCAKQQKGTVMNDRAAPRAALWLGWAAVLPFAAGAIGPWFGLTIEPFTGHSLLIYGAVILSFMGGVHAGLALRDAEPAQERLAASAIPALVAWLAALAGGWTGLVMLAGAFAILLAYDIAATRRGAAPHWYPGLRWPLTIVVVLLLLLGARQAL
jgi:hypothetical protein